MIVGGEKFTPVGRTLYTAEASTLGWPPGVVPPTLRMGGVLFDLMETKRHGEEIHSWVYKAHSGSGVTLEIFND